MKTSSYKITTTEQLPPWKWMDQLYQKEDYPTIVNQQGTSVSIAPRRYVVQFNLIPGKNIIQSPQDHIISLLKPIIKSTHNDKKLQNP